MEKKFAFLADLLDKMGVPLVNEEIKTMAEVFFQEIEQDQAARE